MEEYFTNIYENQIWGNNIHNEFKGNSGGGSSVEYNKDSYVNFLRDFISYCNIKTVVDLGSGDFRCGKLIYDDLDIQYTGYDAYKKVVDYNSKEHSLPKYSFLHLDFFNKKEEIVGGDLCILKDVLQHWKMDEIYTFLDYIIEKNLFKFILLCNCSNQIVDNPDNHDRSTGLSCSRFPLKKYNAVKLYTYNSKEVSVIYKSATTL